MVVITDIKTNNLKAVIHNKEQIDRNLDTALDDGVSKVSELGDNNKIIINKDAAMNSFFVSLHSSFGILSDQDQREKMNLYIPVITITTEDGYYVYYSDEYRGKDGYTYLSKRWSEKLPYYYEDEDFIYGFTLGDIVTIYDKHGLLDPTRQQYVFQFDYHDVQTMEQYAVFRAARPSNILLQDEVFELIRKETIIRRIESTMAYYTSHHNLIASQYGITYNFNLPAMREEEWAPYLDDVSMFVVFQGYPYGNGVGETYNRIASAGARIKKNTLYYLEQKDWYLLYHKSSCSELKRDNVIVKEEAYNTIESCAKEGAYACQVCNQTGVGVRGAEIGK